MLIAAPRADEGVMVAVHLAGRLDAQPLFLTAIEQGEVVIWIGTQHVRYMAEVLQPEPRRHVKSAVGLIGPRVAGTRRHALDDRGRADVAVEEVVHTRGKGVPTPFERGPIGRHVVAPNEAAAQRILEIE